MLVDMVLKHLDLYLLLECNFPIADDVEIVIGTSILSLGNLITPGATANAPAVSTPTATAFYASVGLTYHSDSIGFWELSAAYVGTSFDELETDGPSRYFNLKFSRYFTYEITEGMQLGLVITLAEFLSKRGVSPELTNDTSFGFLPTISPVLSVSFDF